MGGGIGSIGGMGVNIGGNINATGSLSSHKSPVEFEPSVKHKKHHGGDNSFAIQLKALNDNLKTQKVAGAQSGVTGETGTRINKFA